MPEPPNWTQIFRVTSTATRKIITGCNRICSILFTVSYQIYILYGLDPELKKGEILLTVCYVEALYNLMCSVHNLNER